MGKECYFVRYPHETIKSNVINHAKDSITFDVAANDEFYNFRVIYSIEDFDYLYLKKGCIGIYKCIVPDDANNSQEYGRISRVKKFIPIKKWMVKEFVEEFNLFNNHSVCEYFISTYDFEMTKRCFEEYPGHKNNNLLLQNACGGKGEDAIKMVSTLVNIGMTCNEECMGYALSSGSPDHDLNMIKHLHEVHNLPMKESDTLYIENIEISNMEIFTRTWDNTKTSVFKYYDESG